jgi:superfamily I DNA/RNA helicase
MQGPLGLGVLLEMIAREGPMAPMLNLDAEHRAYLAGLLVRYGAIPTPSIRVTTIHGSKGREADTVIVIPDMARASYREYTDGRGGYEGENRVAYVAVTRAKRRLIIVNPSTRRAYDYPRLRAAMEAA